MNKRTVLICFISFLLSLTIMYVKENYIIFLTNYIFILLINHHLMKII